MESVALNCVEKQLKCQKKKTEKHMKTANGLFSYGNKRKEENEKEL